MYQHDLINRGRGDKLLFFVSLPCLVLESRIKNLHDSKLTTLISLRSAPCSKNYSFRVSTDLEAQSTTINKRHNPVCQTGIMDTGINLVNVITQARDAQIMIIVFSCRFSLLSIHVYIGFVLSSAFYSIVLPHPLHRSILCHFSYSVGHTEPYDRTCNGP